MELTMPIPGFPNYYVHADGFVTDESRGGSTLREYHNQLGYIYVVMIDRHGEKKVRQVNRLVCAAFKEPMSDHFTNVIHLDYNRDNCHIDNLEWRPKWFTIQYNRQGRNTEGTRIFPIEILETGETFRSIPEAARQLGLLENEIFDKVDTLRTVFPFDYTFRSAH